MDVNGYRRFGLLICWLFDSYRAHHLNSHRINSFRVGQAVDRIAVGPVVWRTNVAPVRRSLFESGVFTLVSSIHLLLLQQTQRTFQPQGPRTQVARRRPDVGVTKELTDDVKFSARFEYAATAASAALPAGIR